MFLGALTGAILVSGAATAQPTEKTRFACERTYTAGEYRAVARKLYRLERMPPRVHIRLFRIRRCAVHREAHHAMTATTIHQRKLRRRRQARNCGTAACNRKLGEYLTVRRYGAAGWRCLAPIIDQESGWRHTVNYGGFEGHYLGGDIAYGIPQAKPGSKMSSAGADWEFNPRTQIRWLFGYVDGRYGGPCGALQHKQATDWY